MKQTPASLALSTALNLAAMSPEDLATTSLSLAAAEQRYERMSGICATLGGLVLLEAKRRLPHGAFGDWCSQHFGKSDRDAQRRMRVAAEFLGKTKSDTRVAFESTQLLLSDFAAALKEDEASPLDESNPVVAAVAKFVDGRSYRQILSELPYTPRGGNTYDRAEKGKGKTGITAQPPSMQAMELLVPAAEQFFKQWPKHWLHLPHSLLKEWDGVLLDMRKAIKGALEDE